MADKSASFSAAVSSNRNESMNASICSKAPKSRLYGKSASHNYRVSCAVNKKTDGENYMLTVAKKLQLSPGKHTKMYCNTTNVREKKPILQIKTDQLQKASLVFEKKKSELRHNKEISEGTTYSLNMALLEPDECNIPIADINLNLKPIVVFFDL